MFRFLYNPRDIVRFNWYKWPRKLNYKNTSNKLYQQKGKCKQEFKLFFKPAMKREDNADTICLKG